MIQVKVSLQGAPPGASMAPFTRTGSNSVDGVTFHINDNTNRADVWLVVEGPNGPEERCTVPEGALIHLTAEPARPSGYLSESPGLPEFMRQFDHFFTCLDYVSINGTSTLPFLPWMIHANHGPSIFTQGGVGYADLASLEAVPKSREISVICSTQRATAEHRMRLRFVEHLADRLGSRLDWFGNGRMPIPVKWDGIAPYKYSIAMENQANRNSITEKIQDVFLGWGFPIYWGAPNIGEFFDPRSYLAIDARDFRGAVTAIEELLEQDPYEERREAIRQSRMIVLDDLNVAHRMASIARVVHESTRANDARLVTVASVESLIAHSASTRLAVAMSRAGRGLSRLSQRILHNP